MKFGKLWNAWWLTAKIIYAGSSNFAGWHIAQANEAARRRNFLGLVSERSPYNLMERTIELEVLPACQAYGLGLLPWSPRPGDCSLERGRRQNRAAAPTMICCSATLPESRASPRTAPGYRNTRASVANWGRSQLMWRWPGCSHNLVSGSRTREQLDGPLQALELTMTPEILKKLDQLFPGPSGPAPEAYTWD